MLNCLEVVIFWFVLIYKNFIIFGRNEKSLCIKISCLFIVKKRIIIKLLGEIEG